MLGRRLERIHMIGGATRNKLLIELTEQQTGLTVEIGETESSTDRQSGDSTGGERSRRRAGDAERDSRVGEAAVRGQSCIESLPRSLMETNWSSSWSDSPLHGQVGRLSLILRREIFRCAVRLCGRSR